MCGTYELIGQHLKGSVTKVTMACIVRCLGGRTITKYSRDAYPEVFLRGMEVYWREDKWKSMLGYVLIGTAARWWAVHSVNLLE